MLLILSHSPNTVCEKNISALRIFGWCSIQIQNVMMCTSAHLRRVAVVCQILTAVVYPKICSCGFLVSKLLHWFAGLEPPCTITKILTKRARIVVFLCER